MGGFFGEDFDVTTPEDASPVKFGASFLRDIKARLKRFLAVMFNLETGQMRNNVVTSDMLTDLVTAGTYTEVTVNSKGLVTKGTTATTQQSATPFRAIFSGADVGPTAVIDKSDGTGFTTQNGTGAEYTSGSSGVYQNTYSSNYNSNYVSYTFNIPAEVRRVKAIIVGGGGGKSGTNTNGGGGGEMVITTFNVESTNINTMTVRVGGGGAETKPGGVSSVKAGDAYAEAGGGAAGGASGGAAVSGNNNGVMTTIVFPGTAGAAGTGGATGGYLKHHGSGAPLEANDTAGDAGIVILEWLQ